MAIKQSFFNQFSWIFVCGHHFWCNFYKSKAFYKIWKYLWVTCFHPQKPLNSRKTICPHSNFKFYFFAGKLSVQATKIWTDLYSIVISLLQFKINCCSKWLSVKLCLSLLTRNWSLSVSLKCVVSFYIKKWLIIIKHRNRHSKMKHQMELLFCPQTTWPIRVLE